VRNSIVIGDVMVVALAAQHVLLLKGIALAECLDDVVQHVGIGHILVGIGGVLLNWVLDLDDDGRIAVLREEYRVQQFSIGILDVLKLCKESVERFLIVGH
jgi:hypothetical protein